jgi:hypothetical protein
MCQQFLQPIMQGIWRQRYNQLKFQIKGIIGINLAYSAGRVQS